jgi:hypothetical protein
MALERHCEGVKHPLGRVEIRDDPLADGDRLGRHAERLRVEPEVDNQFLGRARHAAEVRVEGNRLRVVDLDLRLGGGLRRRLGSLFRHGMLLQVERGNDSEQLKP